MPLLLRHHAIPAQTIEPNDPSWDRLQATAKAAKDDPAAWLAMEDIYGDVGKSPVFAAKFGDALNALWRDGAAVTVKSYLHTS